MNRIENPLRIWHGRDWREWVEENVGEFGKDWWVDREDRFEYTPDGTLCSRQTIAFFMIPDTCKATLFRLRFS